MKSKTFHAGILSTLFFALASSSFALDWTIQTVGGPSPSLAFDANGQPAIAFVQEGLKYTKYSASAWSAAQNVAPSATHPSLAFNPATGKPNIAFFATEGAAEIKTIFFATFNGSTWSLETADGSNSFSDPSRRSPNLAIDTTGTPHIGWGANTTGNGDYSYSTKSAGVWTNELVEGPGGGFASEYSSLALNSAGVPAIIYSNHTNAQNYRVKYIIRTGGVWSAAEDAVLPVVIDETTNNITTPGGALKFDPSNVPHIAYYNGVNGNVSYATRASNGTWTFEVVTAVTAMDPFSISLAIHPTSGQPYIAFRAQNSIKIANKLTGTWLVDTLDAGLAANTGNSGGTSIAMDEAGTTLGLAYEGKYAFSTISTALTIISPSPLNGGTVGRSYSRTFQRINGTAAFTWSKVTGTFPDGLTLNANTGELSGTPTTANQNASFRMRVTDGVNATAEKDFTLAINAVPTITANATLPQATSGLAYSQTVTVTGGTAPLTWSKTSGNLPDGLTLNAATGNLTGTPTTAGSFNFTIQVADANGATASKAFSAIVNNALAITKTSPLPAATAGIAYSQIMTAVGGTGTLTWTITDGALPTGLGINAANGLVSGTTSTTGMANFTVTVTDANNASVTRDFALTVNDAPLIITSSLPDGTINAAYSVQTTAAGGTAPRIWSVATGSLPAGVTLNGTGLISGTPTASGAFNLTLRVTDQNGAVATRALTLTIQAAPQGPNLSAGQTLFSQRCADCHSNPAGSGIPSEFVFAGASKSILDLKGNHRNDSLLNVNDSSKTNLALYLASRDNQTYSVSGLVKNSAGQGFSGATITATSGYQSGRSTTSTGDGSYTLANLAPGDYLLQASKPGVTFAPANIRVGVTRTKYWLGGGYFSPPVPPINFTANEPPTVTLTAPTMNIAYVAPATIELTATASDSDGTVTKVTFYADGQPLGTNTTSPFSFVWTNVTVRPEVIITAVSTDNLGLSTTSSPVTIQVLPPIYVAGISLTNGNLIYNQKCSFCHGSPPGRDPTWSGLSVNEYPGILASLSQYDSYNNAHKNYDNAHTNPAVAAIYQYLANEITKTEKLDLSAYLASAIPKRMPFAGTVRNSSGQPVAGATVNLSSLYNPGVSMTTDSAGNYYVEGMFVGDYTASATYPGSGLDPFYPAAYTLENRFEHGEIVKGVYADGLHTIPIFHVYNTPPIPVDFVPGYRIQGSIRNANNHGLNGVLVWAMKNSADVNSGVASALSDTNGDFTLIVTNGNYDVIIRQNQNYPLQDAYTFSPASRPVTVNGADQTGVAFNITSAPVLTISGKVIDLNGSGMSGVTVSLAEAPGVTATTTANGDYTLTSPDPGTFTVMPARANYIFTPVNRVVTVGVGNAVNVNFTGILNVFTGRITFSNGAGMGGVTVSLAEVPGTTTTTDENGNYTLQGPASGTVTVTPVKTDYGFAPQNRVVTVGVDSSLNLNFTGILNGFTINGTVRTRSTSSGPPFYDTILGEPIPNVAVSIPGQTVYTDVSGAYHLLVQNGTYTITASRSGYVFDPPTLTVTVNGANLSGQHFSGGLQAAFVRTGGNNSNNGSSWELAKSSIQKAINVTANGGQVWVAGGTYFERISFGGISVYGLDNPVINGKPLPFGEPFERGNVVKIDSYNYGGGTNGTRLDGFTIINGLATSPNTGGGIHCTATDSETGPVVIANNLIIGNTARSKGGGIFLLGKATITNNVIVGNNSESEFVGGGGIVCDFGSTSVTIANNLIAGNRAGFGGGGIATYATSILIANNTIVENIVTNSGVGGIFFGANFGGSTSANNIIAFNSSGIGPANSTVTNRNNCVFGNLTINYDGLAPGPGDVSADPQFGNQADSDYHLLPTSPLINAGNNNFVVGLLDLGGEPRVQGAVVDIGAYEGAHQPNIAPTVDLTSPVNGASFSAPASFTMNAIATDADGTVTNVEYYADDSLLGTLNTPPFAFSLNGLQEGTYQLTAAATDNRGARTVSDPVIVTVYPATNPTVTITTPLEGTRLAAPAQITIQASAADSNGSVTNVEFFANGVKIGEDSSTPYSYAWANVTLGTYALTAKATDNSGASTISTPVQITVANPPQFVQQDMIYSGGEFRLPMILETEKSYLIQASTDLVTWTTLQAFTAFGNSMEFIDTQAANYPGRFYRVVLLE